MRAVLIVEDKDAKFEDVKHLVEQLSSDVDIRRATTVVEAENMLTEKDWHFLVLDISMDINGTSKGALGGGHASLGGLDVVDTMYYEALTIPTIIVTGLDYFISPNDTEGSDYIGLDELDAMMSKRLSGQYLGCIRYGIDGWAARFKAACGVLAW